MLWIAVAFAHLPLEVYARTCAPTEINRAQQRALPRIPSGHPPPQETPIAVADHVRVQWPNQAAQAYGIQAGMKRATALAMMPDVQLLVRDVQREREALEQAATWAAQFTPKLHIRFAAEQCAGLLLEVSGSVRLFKGINTLRTQLQVGLMQMGFTVHSACAPTATAAWLLALAAPHHAGQGAHADAPDLDALPLALAPMPLHYLTAAAAYEQSGKAPTVLDQELAAMGAQTIQDLQRLPRGGVARRFGAALLRTMDRALGHAPESFEWFVPASNFASRLELMASVENAPALLFASRRLLMLMCGWLSAHGFGLRTAHLIAEHDSAPPTLIAIEMADASRDLERMVTLLRERLDKTTLPEPCHTLRLYGRETVALNDRNAELFPSPQQSQESLERLVERLQSRLGRDQVIHLHCTPDHRPEAAWHASLLGAAGAVRARAAQDLASVQPASEHPNSAHIGGMPRPMWLLPNPVPLRERDQRPFHHGPLHLIAGPERIESGWWDNALVERDYFIAEDEDAVLYWVYRERASQSQAASWYLQGYYG